MIEIVQRSPYAHERENRIILTPRFLVTWLDTDDFEFYTAEEVGQVLGGN